MNKSDRKQELQNRILELDKEVASIKEAIATLDLQIENAKLKADEINLKSEREVYHKELAEKKLELERVESQFTALKRFNRERCLNNVDMLLAQKNKKLGELETNSGNRPGYLSRMKSGKSNSDPSIEFLMTASDELEVPLDLLVASDLTDLTTTEKYMLEFMQRLVSDTNDDELEWTRETLSELEKIEVTHNIFGDLEVAHPLYEIVEERTDAGRIKFAVYNSLFFKDCGVKPCGNGYHTSLAPNNQWIYIMECTKGDDRLNWRKKQFFEIYMVQYDAYGDVIAKKICNTLEASSPLVATIDSLIKAIIVSISHVHIDDSVRSAIDAYMNRDKFGDRESDEELELPFN